MTAKSGEKGALPAGLYLVATPIGNLGDITLRALDVLEGATVIACEDSRVTGKLLSAHAIKTPMTAYHDHNATRARPPLIRRMIAGDAIALVSDAGTPLISDPGYKLVTAARDAGLLVTVIPGASAALSALLLSGLPSDAFFFAGFLAPKTVARKRALASLATVPGSLIFYESARRLAAFLTDAHDVFGSRRAAIARELTKLHEEVVRGTLDELAARYADAPSPKGEIVIVIAPGDGDDAATTEIRLDELLMPALNRHSLRDAVDMVAAETGLARKRVYARALELAERALAAKPQ
jgi:16S rRNA (cytidine1402-2'-O)-methyltransferase